MYFISESPRENSCVKNSPELKVEVSSLPGSPTQLNEDLLKSNSMPSAPYMRACEPLVICDQKKVDFLYDLVVQVCFAFFSIFQLIHLYGVNQKFGVFFTENGRLLRFGNVPSFFDLEQILLCFCWEKRQTTTVRCKFFFQDILSQL